MIVAITASAASENSSGSSQAAAIEASMTKASAAPFVTPRKYFLMRGRGRLLTRGANFGEQELHVGLLANCGQMGDRIISTGDHKFLTGLDAGEQVGQMRFRLGNLYGGGHRRGPRRWLWAQNRRPNKAGQAVGLITSDKHYFIVCKYSLREAMEGQFHFPV